MRLPKIRKPALDNYISNKAPNSLLRNGFNQVSPCTFNLGIAIAMVLVMYFTSPMFIK